MATEAETFLAECCKQPTAVDATDKRWTIIKDLKRGGLVTLEWRGPRATLIRPTAKGRVRAGIA